MRPLYVAISMLALVSCAQSPTGRHQILMATDTELSAQGAQEFEQIKQQTPISTNTRQKNYVRCVADSVLRAVPENPAEWEVVLFNDAQANAFAIPGKKIGVYTGLLQYAQTQDQLAAVLGHEVAHVLAQHANERASTSNIAGIGLDILGGTLQNNANKDLILGAVGTGAELGIMLPFSRAHESEADALGQTLMAKGGFNPAASVQLWQNMAASGGGAPLEFLSTHPSGDTRIQNLQKGLASSQPLYQQATSSGIRPRCQQ